MKYLKRNWKYETAEEWVFQLNFTVAENISTDFISLTTDGRLFLAKHFCWDGASGPTLDTPASIAPSAAHDALYQLIRKGFLPPDFIDVANREFLRLLEENGMWWWRRKLWFMAVEEYGKSYLNLGDEPVVYDTPTGDVVS